MWFRGASFRTLRQSRALGRGIRAALVTPAALIALTVAGYSESSLLAAFAIVLLLVISDFSGPRRERFASIIILGVGGSLTLTLGAALQPWGWAVVLGALILGATVSILTVLRGFMTRAVIPILLPYFLTATTDQSWSELGDLQIGWLFGTLVSAVAAVTMWPYFPREQLISSLRNVMHTQASVIDDLAHRRNPRLHEQEMTDQTTAMAIQYYGQANRPGSAFRRERQIMRSVESARSLSLLLRVLSAEPVSRQTSTLLDSSVTALTVAADPDSPLQDRDDAIANLAEARDTHRDALVGREQDLLAAGQGSDALTLARRSFPARVISLLTLGLVRDAAFVNTPHHPRKSLRFGNILLPDTAASNTWAMIRSELQWGAPWLRNAIRLGLAMAVGVAIVQYTGVERGYWVILGTLSVLRIDLTGTTRNSWQVAQGQVLGFLIGLGMLFALQEAHWLVWVFIPITVGLQGYMTDNAPVIAQQAGFTALLVSIVSISSTQLDIVVIRITDVALGLLVAFVISLVIYPRGIEPHVRSALLTSLTSGMEAFTAAARTITQPSEQSTRTARQAIMQAQDDLQRASDAVDLAITQRSSLDTQSTLWLRLFSANQHVAFVAQVAFALRQTPSTDTGILSDEIDATCRYLQRRFVLAFTDITSHSDALPDHIPDIDLTSELSQPVVELSDQMNVVVEEWAQNEDSEHAWDTLQYSWLIGWMGEIDKMASNTVRLSNALAGTPQTTALEIR